MLGVGHMASRLCTQLLTLQLDPLLLQDGPIHDAQWSPDGLFFVVIAGFMPAKTLLFNDKCKPVFDMGAGPHNIVRWNPHVSWEQQYSWCQIKLPCIACTLLRWACTFLSTDRSCQSGQA